MWMIYAWDIARCETSPITLIARLKLGYSYEPETSDTRRFRRVSLFFVQRRRVKEARQGFRVAGLHGGLAPPQPRAAALHEFDCRGKGAVLHEFGIVHCPFSPLILRRIKGRVGEHLAASNWQLAKPQNQDLHTGRS